MKIIELTQGKVTLVSDHRFEYLNQWKWYAHQSKSGLWYAERKEGWPLRKNIKMHRVIMNVTNPEIEIDHWDRDGLNNQDDNLRIATDTENARNRGKNKRNTSGYKGVVFDKRYGKYRAKIMVNCKDVHLGMFISPIDAACAYDAAAKQYHGEFAVLNFK